MNFPIIKSSKVESYYVCLALTITDGITGYLHGRKYYMVNYRDGTHQVFMTTNEPVDWQIINNLDDEFILIKDFDHLVVEIECSEDVDFLINTGFNSPPKYIYYDILIIHSELKSKFSNHLKDAISGFTDQDYSPFELKQLKKWFKMLANDK